MQLSDSFFMYSLSTVSENDPFVAMVTRARHAAEVAHVNKVRGKQELPKRSARSLKIECKLLKYDEVSDNISKF